MGLISYEALNSCTQDDAPPLKLEAEQMEKVVRATFRDFVSNDGQELGEALWMANQCDKLGSVWPPVIREKVFASLESLRNQGYFDAEKKFRRAASELWIAFGLACTTGVPASWTERADSFRSAWREDALNGKLGVGDQLIYCLAAFPGSAWRGYRSDPTKDLMNLSVRQLRLALKEKGVDFSACVEKTDLVKLLLSKKN